jgi:hypothetical protein
MNEQTKLELLKIASNLTIAQIGNSGGHGNNIKKQFEHFCFYLFENFDKLGIEEKVTK